MQILRWIGNLKTFRSTTTGDGELEGKKMKRSPSMEPEHLDVLKQNYSYQQSLMTELMELMIEVLSWNLWQWNHSEITAKSQPNHSQITARFL